MAEVTSQGIGKPQGEDQGIGISEPQAWGKSFHFVCFNGQRDEFFFLSWEGALRSVSDDRKSGP